MSITSVTLQDPTSYTEFFVDDALTMRGFYSEGPGTTHPVNISAAMVPPGLSFGSVSNAIAGTVYEFSFPLSGTVPGLHDIYLYATNGPDYVESVHVQIRVKLRASEGEWVVFRDVSGRREYLDSSDGWTVSEKAARKVGHESVALDLAATHGGQAAKKRLAFTGLA